MFDKYINFFFISMFVLFIKTTCSSALTFSLTENIQGVAKFEYYSLCER